jgi:DASS family divalent anion:Na+ symporter
MMSVNAKDNLVLLFMFIIGATLWNVPAPYEISIQSWHLVILFVETIICITLAPLPISAIAIVALTVATLTGTLTLSKSLAGFSSEPVWLIVAAFFLAKGFDNTGLGKKIAFYLVARFGNNLLKLSYSFVIVDFILSPMIPSVISRGGGIIYPILKSLIDTANENSQGSQCKKVAIFLVQTAFHANIVTCALFLTAMAANPLIVSLAKLQGVEITWNTWALAACVPGIINLILLPLLMYVLIRPTPGYIHHLQNVALEKVSQMNRFSLKEFIMASTFLITIVLWITGSYTGINPTTVALVGSSILFVTRVISWDDAAGEKGAWTSFIWFGAILTMSNALSEFGITTLLGNKVEMFIAQYSSLIKIVMLVIIFFFLHYLFASITAYISVMYSVFLIILINTGVPSLVASLYLGFVAILSAGLTHYGVGSAPIFYSSGYLSTKSWWKVGFIVSIFNLLIWTFIGGMWWRTLGWL